MLRVVVLGRVVDTVPKMDWTIMAGPAVYIQDALLPRVDAGPVCLSASCPSL